MNWLGEWILNSSGYSTSAMGRTSLPKRDHESGFHSDGRADPPYRQRVLELSLVPALCFGLVTAGSAGARTTPTTAGSDDADSGILLISLVLALAWGWRSRCRGHPGRETRVTPTVETDTERVTGVREIAGFLCENTAIIVPSS